MTPLIIIYCFCSEQVRMMQRFARSVTRSHGCRWFALGVENDSKKIHEQEKQLIPSKEIGKDEELQAHWVSLEKRLGMRKLRPAGKGPSGRGVRRPSGTLQLHHSLIRSLTLIITHY